MALRIEEPDRLRVATAISLAFGVLLIEGSSATGPLAWVGIALFCLGTALLDALGEGKVGSRQAGILLILAGIAVTTWALLVVLLMHFFLEGAVTPALYLVLVGGVVMLVSGGMLRRLRPGEAVLSTWTRALRASIRSSEQTEAA
jgi:drug/metabolite transporter (DMT)-like permease